MNAVEFVKKYGWEDAKLAVKGLLPVRENMPVFDYGSDELKRLVESYELIEGDLEYAKKFYADCAFRRDKHLIRYKQAILDVESCM